MAKFKYTALNQEGQKVSGKKRANTAAGAKTALAVDNLQVIDLKERKSFLQIELTRGKVPRAEIMHFSRQLAAFVRAGIPMLDALQVIAEESGNPIFRHVLLEIGEAIRQGETISAAFAAHPKAFPSFYVSMVRSAEQTGQLDIVLDQLAKYIERDVDARRKIRSALAYPAVIFVMAIGAIVVLTVFVLPRFRSFFQSLNARLPLPTRILLNFTTWLGHWWWAVVAGIVFVGLVTYLAIKTERGRRAWHSLLLNLPAVGEVVRYSIIERFCRTLASLIRAGVPIPEAMVTVSEGTNNKVFEAALHSVREDMMEGGGISGPITRTNLFPSAVTQMVRVGEDTGTLDQQLETAGAFYEQELDYKIKRMTTLFEPAMIIFVGILVGFVAVALVSAMYGIFRQVGQA